MAEEGWIQGDCQAAPGFPSLLINTLESLGIAERPRYYNREASKHQKGELLIRLSWHGEVPSVTDGSCWSELPAGSELTGGVAVVEALVLALPGKGP